MLSIPLLKLWGMHRITTEALSLPFYIRLLLQFSLETQPRHVNVARQKTQDDDEEIAIIGKIKVDIEFA